MIFAIALILIVALAQLLKNNFGLAYITIIAAAFISSLVSLDITKALIDFGITLDIKTLTIIVKLSIVLVPLLLIFYKSGKTSSNLIKTLIKSCLLVALLVCLFGNSINDVIEFDNYSKDIQNFLLPHAKWIIAGSGLYGLWLLATDVARR